MKWGQGEFTDVSSLSENSGIPPLGLPLQAHTHAPNQSWTKSEVVSSELDTCRHTLPSIVPGWCRATTIYTAFML